MTKHNKKTWHDLSRRTFVTAAGASLFAGTLSAIAAPSLEPGGLYSEPWLLKTAGQLGTDFVLAEKANKNFAIVWEMRSCPWCKVLHTENFAREDIADYVQKNFAIVQLNLRGRREITDIDGEKLPEAELALKYGIHSTPMFQFFKQGGPGGPEVGRAGYLRPGEFLTLLHFVRERGYEEGTPGEWAARHRNPA